MSCRTTNHNENPVSKSTKSSSSHELMQGNYYDRTRLISDHSTTSHRSTTDQIDIDIEDYKDRKKVNRYFSFAYTSFYSRLSSLKIDTLIGRCDSRLCVCVTKAQNDDRLRCSFSFFV